MKPVVGFDCDQVVGKRCEPLDAALAGDRDGEWDRVVRQVPQLGRVDVEMLPWKVSTSPPNSARMISTASSSISCRARRGANPADGVLVEALAAPSRA